MTRAADARWLVAEHRRDDEPGQPPLGPEALALLRALGFPTASVPEAVTGR